MKELLLSTLFMLTSVLSAFGQIDYLDEGNGYLNDGQLEQAEQTFRDGIKAEPSNLVYQCQLGLALVQQKKYEDAEQVLGKVLQVDPTNVGAIWYSGISSFYAEQDKQAIARFEQALLLLDESSGQYFAANWFIGNCYSNLLSTEGLTYEETDRMFECYEEYLRLQPDADDAFEIREYVERKKSRRPSSNVKRWIDM